MSKLKSYLGAVMAIASLLFAVNLQAAITEITTPTKYYLIHSSGLHLAKGNADKAVLESATISNPQILTFTPRENGTYNIQAPDGSYLTQSGSYNTTFNGDPEAKAAQFEMLVVNPSYIKLKCMQNNLFLGTDMSAQGSSVFSNKNGADSMHYWFLSEDPQAQPGSDQFSYIINPEAKRQKFDGWGVSLCWWANMCGKWSDDKIDEIIDWLVSPEGLNFRIFRYNIGGGDDPENKNCTPHHMGKGKGLRAEMEGFKDSSDGPYIWTRDEAQRKILLKIKEKRPDAIFEAFSNSAPWYMTYSGCCSGNTDSSKDNLKPEFYEEFAHYLVDVCKHYKDEYGIEFKTLDPFNEPMTSYWGCGGGQEGCHFDVKSQIAFIKVLSPILKESGLNTVISAADETAVDQSVKDFIEYRKAGVLDLIGQFNTHTYSADDKSRTKLSSLCREENMPVWMSEVGAPGSGISGNLGMAQKAINDIRHIMPSAWIDWQYIEENNDQWCLVKAFSFAQGKYKKVKNYSVRSQLSRYIKEGSTILTSLNSRTLAALSPDGKSVVLVAVNTGSIPACHIADLTMFKSVGNEISATYTDKQHDVETFDNYTITDGILSFELPKESIATFVIPVTVEESKATELKSDASYLICPRANANVAMNATEDKVAVTSISLADSQVFKLTKEGERYRITNLNSLTLTASEEYPLTASSSSQGIQNFNVTPIDDLYFKITDPEGTRGFDLNGESLSEGTSVGIYNYAADAPIHRQWLLCRLPENYKGAEVISPISERLSQHIMSISTPTAGELAITFNDGGNGILTIYSPDGRLIFTRQAPGREICLPLKPNLHIINYRHSSGNDSQLIMVR